MSRRAVITGIGVVAPNGIGTEAFWQATCAGESGIDRIQRFDPSPYATRFAGEVDGFEPTNYIEQRLVVQTDRWTWMALAASKMALEDADFDPETYDDPYKMSVITSSSSGGNEFGQREIQALWGKGPRFVGAYQSIAWFYAASTGQIAIRHLMKGPCGVVVSEGAGGLDALSQARRYIRRGVELAVCGGTEAPIGPYALTCQLQNGLLSQEDARDAYRPFDRRAGGYFPGEGGAIMVVEHADHARSRSAPRVYAEIIGHGATQDGYHHARPAPDGRQLARAMRLALEDAGTAPEEIDAVFADGMGAPEWDAIEAKAIHDVFGDRSKIPVTVPKSMVGRLYSGGAALDVACAALALRDGVLPPTVNVDEGYDLNLVTDGERELDLNNVLVVARGFGGFNSAMVLRAPAS